MEPKMISLQCTKCGGKVAFDAEHSTLKCPYCGETALVQEETAVQLKKLDNSHEIEMLKLKTEIQRQDDKEGYILMAIIWIILGIIICFI